MSKNDLFTQAFAFYVHGYSVMPLGKDKRPLLGSWKKYQDTPATEEEIRAWWKKWPNANIGIITGKISGITVVDIDTGGEKTVAVSKFPPTYTVRTPSGGYHLYYQYDQSIQQTANTFPQFPHVDIRNDGGYVVAPPSRCEYTKGKEQIKGTYKILKEMPPAVFPAKLFGIETKTTTEKKPSIAGLLKGFPSLAEGDGRNVALTKVVGKIVKLVPVADYESVAWPMILAVNARFKKQLEEKEVRVIFNSIKSKEAKKPLASVEFLRTDKGVIIANVENVCRTFAADKDLIGHFRLNTFSGVIETNFGRSAWEAFQRADVSRVRSHLMSTYPHFTKIGHAEVEDAMLQISERNRVSPPVEYLKSLVWDKTPRLDNWLEHTYGVPDDVYHRAVASNWMKGLVKRLVFPGCKFDYVLVLEGRQGIRKSTSLAVLGGDWHVETVFSPDNKDFFMLFAGNAIVEFSEGETLSRTEAKKLKAVITMQHDKYRPPYERSAKDFPRQCVFAMTTNQDQYLKDETGNRRWLPVKVERQADIEWLTENRDQLYAEAYHRIVELKETTYEFPEKETAHQQALRQIGDPREDTIVQWYYTVLTEDQRQNGITTRMAYIGALEGGFGSGNQMERSDEMVISAILKEGLKLEKRRAMIKGTRYYMFYPTPESEADKPTTEQAKELLKSNNLEF